MTCIEFYTIALPLLVASAASSVVNMFLQAYDILWCRWHDCGKSSKNSVAKTSKFLHYSEPFEPADQSIGSVPEAYMKECRKE